MKVAPEPLRPLPADQALGEFTSESIALVRDFTARKTLEQAHVFAHGLAEVFLAGPSEIDDDDLAQKLAAVGISLADAEQIAGEGVALVRMMNERDRCAELLHAAVLAASEGERMLYERLSSFAGLLRNRLGARAPALVQFGVPPESVDTIRCSSRSVSVRPDPTPPTAPPPPK
jgi:hypothetical protein